MQSNHFVQDVSVKFADLTSEDTFLPLALQSKPVHRWALVIWVVWYGFIIPLNLFVELCICSAICKLVHLLK